MPLYTLLVGSFVFLGVSCIQTVPSDKKFEIKSLQQILKVKLPLISSGRGNHGGEFLNAVSVRDISNAFNVVTNDSKQINQLIPKMYDVSSQNPAYIFSLPEGLKHSFLTMRRNSFDRPVFPNLTSSYVRFMRNKEILGEYFNANQEREFNDGNSLLEDRVNPNSVQEDESTLLLNLQTERNFIDFLNKINELNVADLSDKTKGSTDEWSLLGLHGWEGVLSKQNNGKKSVFEEIKPSNRKTKEKQNQAWDLPGRMQKQEDNLLRAMKDTKIMSIVGNLSHQAMYPITSMHEDHSDEDVYIARVNDPFGHSTKWNVKNQSSNQSVEDRKKRGVIELYSMIKCSTGCDPLVLKGYGCYCGFLGDGVPVDGIDRCCRLHDKCYEYSNCISYLEYFVPYIWKCYRGKPLCAIDHGEWGGPNSCAARLCQCDLSLSRCLRRFLCPHRRAICRTSRLRMLQNLLLNF